MSAIIETIDDRGVATVTLNRPERRNALDQAFVVELTAALRRLEARPDIRVVVLAGAGANFCAGGDIEWMRRMAEESFEANERDALLLADLMHGLDRLAKPTLAVVHGAAYGGGVGLAVCCDIAIAGDDATFCLSEVKIGLTPSIIGPFVTRAIGARRARRYVLTAEVLPAACARQIGLVHALAPAGELPGLRERVIASLLAGAPGAQAEAKASIARYETRVIDDSLARETARRIAELRAAPEGREGLSAFLEKRPPAWKPRRDVS
jgi:methylglutaconyl-CoA hydratase